MKKKIFLPFVLFLGVCILLAGCTKKLQKVTVEKGTSPGMQEERVTAPPSPDTDSSAISEAEPEGGEEAIREETVVAKKEVEAARTGVTETTKIIGLQDIFFDFDRAMIRDDAIPTLHSNATWLKSNPRVKVQIEGHADERGTTEYNLALGEKRAQIVKRHLVSLGIEPQRISILSYGEEKPFCKGSSEECWQQNRRGHFARVP